MAEFLTRNIKMAMSKTAEGLDNAGDGTLAYNEIKVDSGDEYVGILTTGRTFYVPDKEKIDDLNKIGTGREFPTEQRSTYLMVPSAEVAEELNANVAAMLLRRAMGGEVTSTALTLTDSYEHKFGLDYDNIQLPSSSCLWAIGGADYIWGGMVVESFQIQQARSAVPTMTATLVGSGINRQLRYLTSTTDNIEDYNPIAANLAGYAGGEASPTPNYTGPHGDATASPNTKPAFPAPDPQYYMVGAETNITYSVDGAPSPFALADSANQRLTNFSWTLTNNHKQDDRRPGDSRIYQGGDPKNGHYMGRMRHGDRTFACECTVMLDDELIEFQQSFTDEIIRDFTYHSKGLYLPNTEDQASVKLIMPKSYFRTVRGADDNGDAIITFALFPVLNDDDALLYASEIVRAEIVNADADLF